MYRRLPIRSYPQIKSQTNIVWVTEDKTDKKGQYNTFFNR